MTYKNDKNVSNISFINKDFESLWTEILALIPKLTNKWVPSEANESDPLAVLLKEQAIMADKINYNVDKNILELFPQSLTQLRSAYDVYNSMGYYPDWYVSATVDLTLSRNGKVLIVKDSESQSDKGESLFIDVFTSFSDSESKTVYVTTKAKNLNINESDNVPAIQGVALDFAVDNDRCITTDYLDAQNRIYFAESNVAQNGIFISEQKDYSDLRFSDSVWKRVDNLSQELGRQKVYKFGVDAVNNACYIQFPNDIGSLIGSGLYIKYIKSDGIDGNITVKTITQFLDSISLKNHKGDTLVANNDENIKINDLFTYTTNLLGVTNGKDPMTIDEMSLNYDKVKNVFNTLVSLLDYKNYLYNYKNQDSRNIVSNIQVADRSNDLYKSYTVKSFDTKNNINVDIVKSNINGNGNIDSTAVLTAYSIRFYPLAYSSDVLSLNNFNNTFTPISKRTDIDLAINDVKTLNHNILENGSPIILTYDLNGYIYLNNKVSQIDANQIKNKVVNALWTKFNSRELGFGEMPDYGELVDTIKGADDRISYVALNPITEYKQKEDKTFNKYYQSLDIIKRSILAGITPWSNRHDYLDVKFGQIFDKIQDNSDPPKALDKLPLVNDAGKDNVYLYTTCLPKDSSNKIVYGDANALKLYDNEQLSLFTPSYHDSKIYTNYIYYKYISTNKDVEARTFKANNIYKLKDNEQILIRETKPTVNDTNALDTLKNVYIKVDFDLKPTKDYVAIGTKQICVQEQIIYNCKYNSNEKLYFSDTQCLKDFLIANKSSSGSLLSKSYYIPTGSYIIRISYDTSNVATAFEIVGEGSTISTSSIKGLTDTQIKETLDSYKPVDSFDINYLSEYGDLQSIDTIAKSVKDLFPNSSNDSYISLSLNDIMSFGSGYELYFYHLDDTAKTALKFAATTSVNKDNITKSTISLLDNDISELCAESNRSDGLNPCLRYKKNDTDDYTEVSFGDLDIKCKFGLLLNNISNNIKLQKIESTVETIAGVPNLTYIAHTHNIHYKSGSTDYTLITDNSNSWTKYFACNKYLNIGLNQKLYLTSEKAESVHVYIYENKDDSYSNYIDIITNNGVNLPVYVDSSNKQLPIIIRVIKSNNDIAYILTTTVTSNTDALLKIEGVSRYYQPVLYASDAKVYVMNFIGTSTTDPTGATGATITNHTTFKVGDVCLYTNDKYAYNYINNVLTWTKFNSTNWQSLAYTSLINIYNNRSDSTTKNYVELTNNYIYDAQFDPTYEPTDPIDDPTNTSTYFNKNHILNRYVMAQLKGYNTDNSEATSSNPLPNLKISDLSIIK